jgi:hypothetical protein
VCGGGGASRANARPILFYLRIFLLAANLKRDKYKIELVEITNTMHGFASLLYSICWLLHVSAVVCIFT